MVYFDRLFEAGEELPSLQPWHVAENKWRGARYGLDAMVITSRATDERWLNDELEELLSVLGPTAATLNCTDELNLVAEIVDRGAGYQRQREVFEATGDWRRVVDASCREMTALAW